MTTERKELCEGLSHPDGYCEGCGNTPCKDDAARLEAFEVERGTKQPPASSDAVECLLDDAVWNCTADADAKLSEEVQNTPFKCGIWNAALEELSEYLKPRIQAYGDARVAAEKNLANAKAPIVSGDLNAALSNLAWASGLSGAPSWLKDIATTLTAHAAAKDAEIARLREALEFYAAPYTHKDEYGQSHPVPDFYGEMSFGDRAIDALADPAQTVGEVG